MTRHTQRASYRESTHRSPDTRSTPKSQLAHARIGTELLRENPRSDTKYFSRIAYVPCVPPL